MRLPSLARALFNDGDGFVMGLGGRGGIPLSCRVVETVDVLLIVLSLFSGGVSFVSVTGVTSTEMA